MLNFKIFIFTLIILKCNANIKLFEDFLEMRTFSHENIFTTGEKIQKYISIRIDIASHLSTSDRSIKHYISICIIMSTSTM